MTKFYLLDLAFKLVKDFLTTDVKVIKIIPNIDFVGEVEASSLKCFDLQSNIIDFGIKSVVMMINVSIAINKRNKRNNWKNRKK